MQGNSGSCLGIPCSVEFIEPMGMMSGEQNIAYWNRHIWARDVILGWIGSHCAHQGSDAEAKNVPSLRDKIRGSPENIRSQDTTDDFPRIIRRQKPCLRESWTSDLTPEDRVHIRTKQLTLVTWFNFTTQSFRVKEQYTAFNLDINPFVRISFGATYCPNDSTPKPLTLNQERTNPKVAWIYCSGFCTSDRED
jgi:hypothetical protein